MTLEHYEMKENEEAQSGMHLEFFIDKEAYGIPVRYVTEIINIQPVNTLPEVPDYIQGIINLRGKIIPVIDIGMKFGKQKKDYTDRTCIVVIQTQELTAGLIVDDVSEVMTIDKADIAPPPDVRGGNCCRYISGVGKVKSGIVILLDCERLFNHDETNIIRDSQTKL